MAEKTTDKPRAVRSHDVALDKEYIQWIQDIKQRFRNSQIKAAVKVNSEQLLFNWQLGRDLVVRKAEEKWGSGIVEHVSLDLQAEFPNAKGFSARNLWNMKKWYSFYAENERISDTLQSFNMLIDVEGEKLQQVAAEIPFPSGFSFIPWGHHCLIITKCKAVDEALFYLRRTVERGLSRNALDDCIRVDLYHIYLRCYVMLELKVKPFDPEFAGKLNFYVNAVNEFIRRESDNPTIGLLICKDMDRTEVQLAFQGITTPMGVATYDNIKIKEIQEYLPTAEQIQQQIEIAEEEYKMKLQNKQIQ